MKIVHIGIINAPPIRNFEASELSDVVVLAGPNGVGKTKILTEILSAFQNPANHATCRLIVEATNVAERKAWGGRERLDTAIVAEAQTLQQFLQKGSKRGKLLSGVLNFDANRQFEQIQPYNFNWNFSDPDLEDIGWKYSFQSLKNRFQDTIHTLHRKIRSQKESIATRALKMKKDGGTVMPLDFGDPLEKFKDAFKRLLPGKQLVELDEQRQKIQYTIDGTTLELNSLSSGEREVVSVVFDFLLRSPEDSIVVFDEPELHLHPELAYRLLRTLSDVGARNQFIFCTHSPDIITASLEQSVIFVSPPSGEKSQAITVREDDELAKVMRLLGQSVGVISLGRRIVLIEGEQSSLDKQTYGSILGETGSDLVLVPAGGREALTTFSHALDTVLSKTIWGVDFFMLADGDAAVSVANMDALTKKSSGRLKRLPRYHVENYFLDAHVMAKVFAEMDEADAWTRSPEEIEKVMRDLARPFVSYAASLRVAHRLRTDVGNIDVMPKGVHGIDLATLHGKFKDRRDKEEDRVRTVLDRAAVAKLIEDEHAKLTAALDAKGDEWRRIIPGRPILNALAAQTKMDLARLKRLYLRAAKSVDTNPFQEIKHIFAGFTVIAKSTSSTDDST